MTKISANFRNVLRMTSKDKFMNCQRLCIKSEVISRARLCCLFLSKAPQELRLKRRGFEPLVVMIVIWRWKTILKVGIGLIVYWGLKVFWKEHFDMTKEFILCFSTKETFTRKVTFTPCFESARLFKTRNLFLGISKDSKGDPSH